MHSLSIHITVRSQGQCPSENTLKISSKKYLSTYMKHDITRDRSVAAPEFKCRRYMCVIRLLYYIEGSYYRWRVLDSRNDVINHPNKRLSRSICVVKAT